MRASARACMYVGIVFVCTQYIYTHRSGLVRTSGGGWLSLCNNTHADFATVYSEGYVRYMYEYRQDVE